MKKYITLLIVLIYYHSVNAQVKSQFSQEKIVHANGFFNVDTLRTQATISGVDVEKATLEDERDKDMGLPFRFGIPIDVNYSLNNSGKWFETEQGKVWKLKIRSLNAFSINLIFKRLFLSDNSILYIYNETKTMLVGPITKNEISTKGKFSTDIIQGNTIILELYEPKKEESKNQLLISKVIHGYKDLFGVTNNFGESLGCNYDVRCYSFQNQSDGVAMILLADNSRICSGSLLNNGCQDYAPNILTAFHCIDIGNNGSPCEATAADGAISTTERNRAEDWLFRFQYISPSCNGPEPPSSSWVTYSGSTYLSGWQDSDFALVQMDNPPTGEYNIRYQGWSRSETATSSGISLHHPAGDVMKVSWYNSSPSSNTSPYTIANSNNPYCVKFITLPTDHLWQVPFVGGTTEGGSSGAPLFDYNYRIIGQLLGGPNGCAPITKLYGKLNRSWGMDNNGNFLEGRDFTNSLAPYLTNDPTLVSTNAIQVPEINGPDLVCTTNSTFTLSNRIASQTTVSWSHSSNLQYVSGQGTNNYTVKAKSGQSGQGQVIASISNLCGNYILEISESFWVGSPAYTSIKIDGNSYYPGYQICPGYHWVSVAWTGYPTSVSWTVQPGITYYPGTDELDFYMPQSGFSSVWITANATNVCGGPSSNANIYLSKKTYGCGYYYYSFYPNPVTEELTIEVIDATTDKTLTTNTIDFSVDLYDSDKKLIKQVKNKNNKVTINVESLKRGTYFLHIMDKKEVLKKQIKIE